MDGHHCFLRVDCKYPRTDGQDTCPNYGGTSPGKCSYYELPNGRCTNETVTYGNYILKSTN